jgi:DNA-directed RNA polymerase subunit RPC12/RpoP
VNCNHENRNLEKDEDDDLVCQECGHVIPDDTDVIHTCAPCRHDTINLERDEEGDFVCQECGHCIPEDTPTIKEVRIFRLMPICTTHITCSFFPSPVTIVIAYLLFNSSFFSLSFHNDVLE